jgi:Kef-type K+ transport system membrane component KefB
MDSIIVVGIIILTGFVFGEIAHRVRLPKISGYILAGILLNPGITGIVSSDFLDQTELITNISLSFIAFSVGGSLLFSKIRKLGRQILYTGTFEAEITFFAVSLAFAGLLSVFVGAGNGGWLSFYIPTGLLLGSLAAPTDPSATVAVIHECDAEGEVTSTIVGITAYDDSLGIINYSLAVAVAEVLIAHKDFSLSSSIIMPVISVVGALGMGAIFGLAFTKIADFLSKETIGMLTVLVFALLITCFGVARVLGLEELLAAMTMGAVVVNFYSQHEKIFDALEKHTEDFIFVLFFTLSGMHLKMDVLAGSIWMVIIFVLVRAAGKFFGASWGAAVAGASRKVRLYTAGGLFPQGGIVIGLALMTKQNPAFNSISDIIISVALGAAVIHELAGPIITEWSLKKAGEIEECS